MGSKKKGRPASAIPREARFQSKSAAQAFSKWLRKMGPLPRGATGDTLIKTRERIAEALGVTPDALRVAVRGSTELRDLIRPSRRYEVKVGDLFLAHHYYVWGAAGSKRRAALVREATKRNIPGHGRPG